MKKIIFLLILALPLLAYPQDGNSNTKGSQKITGSVTVSNSPIVHLAATDTPNVRPSVSWRSFRSFTSWTRPADTVSYNGTLFARFGDSKTASSSHFFRLDSVAAQNGGSFILKAGNLFVDTANTTNAAFRAVFLYDSAFVPYTADGGPNTESDSTWFPGTAALGINYSNPNFIGSMDFYPPAPTGQGSGSTGTRLVSTGNWIEGNCKSTSKAIYAKLYLTGPGLYKPKLSGINVLQVSGSQQVSQ